jgi:hypothetical protein
VRARRLSLRALGFAVGFAGALVTIGAADWAGERDLVEEYVAGELDFFAYCRAQDPDLSAAIYTNDARGWRCQGRRNGIWGRDEIDVNAACRQQYGPEARAVASDPASPYSWTCVLPR